MRKWGSHLVPFGALILVASTLVSEHSLCPADKKLGKLLGQSPKNYGLLRFVETEFSEAVAKLATVTKRDAQLECQPLVMKCLRRGTARQPVKHT